MTFWEDMAGDLDDILADDDMGTQTVSYTPHTLPTLEEGETFTPYSVPVLLVSLGRMDDTAAAKITGHVYFSETDLPDPKYLDTMETESGEVWKLIVDAGTNGPIKKWIVERDLRKKPGGD